jgi:4-diphosphocytidyl-2-C-methyl-D-erythritol kinase
MVSFPPCKINLGLHVLRKRGDGYHDIETCFYPLQWTDVLEIIRADQFSFSSTGRAIPGATSANLCVRAFELMRSKFNIGPVSIHLHKILPFGAGLGGGSSNAAWTLRTLNDLFNLRLSVPMLMGLADELGSDCAFFVQDQPMIGIGRGNVLHPVSLSLKSYFIAVIKPGIHVSTADAYRGVTPMLPGRSVEDIIDNTSPVAWDNMLLNDFEKSVFNTYPELQAIKKQLYRSGAVYASMSGSGAAVYGLFKKEVNITQIFPGDESWSGWATV